MIVENNLHIKGSQVLAMTPRLQQAIQLLQLSQMELQIFVTEQIETNPLLSTDEPINESDDSLSSCESLIFECHKTVEDWQNHPAYRSELSLSDYLLQQVNVKLKDDLSKKIGIFLISNLSQDGYLREDLNALSEQINIGYEQIIDVLNTLQTFDPPGIFARSLQECLILQLKDKGIFKPVFATLLNILSDFPNINLSQLAKKCRIPTEQCQEMLKQLRNLNPHPTISWQKEAWIESRIPDVFVKPLPNQEFSIELNMEAQPKVLLNHSYYNKLKKALKTGEDKEFLKNCHTSANWLLNSLQQRALTLQRVAAAIVEHQKQFLLDGIMSLKPLTLRDIAQQLELHESTISRITQDKHLGTPRGIFTFKFFFSQSLSITTNASACASKMVQQMLKDLIKVETSKDPWSDEQIVDWFSKKGIAVARRTIAKYRNLLGIPPSHARKQEGVSF